MNDLYIYKTVSVITGTSHSSMFKKGNMAQESYKINIVIEIIYFIFFFITLCNNYVLIIFFFPNNSMT